MVRKKEKHMSPYATPQLEGKTFKCSKKVAKSCKNCQQFWFGVKTLNFEFKSVRKNNKKF